LVSLIAPHVPSWCACPREHLQSGSVTTRRTISSLTLSGLRLCSLRVSIMTCATSRCALGNTRPLLHNRHSSAFDLVQLPTPRKKPGLVRFILTQVKAIVVYSKPQAWITWKLFSKYGIVVHKNSIESSATQSRTGMAHISFMLIVGYLSVTPPPKLVPVFLAA